MSENKRLDEIENLIKEMAEERKKFQLELYGTTYNLGMEIENNIEKYFQDKRDKNNLKIGDIKFDNVLKGVGESGIFDLDFLLVNSTAIGLVEVKRNLRLSNVKRYFLHTIPKFEEYYRKYYKDKENIFIFACKSIKDKEEEDIIELLKEEKKESQAFILKEISNQKYKKITIQ